MSLTSFSFAGFAFIALISFHLVKPARYKPLLLLVANTVFVGATLGASQAALPLACFLALAYCALEYVRLRPSGFSLFVSITGLVLVFLYLKRYSVLESILPLPFPYVVVGLSYILFRALHLVIDAYYGQFRARIPALSYVNYTCNFLTFVSGPIQLYQDFSAYEKSGFPAPDEIMVHKAFSRIIRGYFTVLVLSATMDRIFTNAQQTLLAEASPAGPEDALRYAMAATAYLLYLFFNFSGYMHIVIGIGWLFGQNLPENFNRPFLARNFLELWTRWHITLSEWFKTYLFNPLMLALARRLPAPAVTPLLGVVAYFVTFLVMGIWHGSTPVFFIYGLFLGAGASLNKLWQIVMSASLGRRGYSRLSERAAYVYSCRGVTFAYFAMGLTGLWADMEQLQHIAARVGVGGAALAFIATAGTSGLLMAAWDRGCAILQKGQAWLAWWSEAALLRDFWLAGVVLLTLMIASFFHQPPEFIYKGF